MDRPPQQPREIPSFLQALRCTCGRALGGTYCDGTHLRPAPTEGCGAATEEDQGPAKSKPGPEGQGSRSAWRPAPLRAMIGA